MRRHNKIARILSYTKKYFCSLMCKSTVIIYITIAPFSYAQAVGDANSGKTIAEQVCVACHGVAGVSVVAIYPILAGQNYAYLLRQLRAYKETDTTTTKPRRFNALMSPNVASLSDSDLQNLAAYYSQQTPKKGFAATTEFVNLGQKIWRGGDAKRGLPACAACHGPAGIGNPPLYPRLMGQHAGYTRDQLEQYRTLKRNNDAQGIMRTIALLLSPQEMSGLSEYIAGLREHLP